jgi:hypothetical protein
MISHFRGRWPDEAVPPEVPVWLHYEVDVASDVVLRSVEVFADGRSERNSVELEARDGFPCLSIVHGPFMQVVADAGLEPIDAQDFEELWRRSADKTFR